MNARTEPVRAKRVAQFHGVTLCDAVADCDQASRRATEDGARASHDDDVGEQDSSPAVQHQSR